jgi:hypothetical protein
MRHRAITLWAIVIMGLAILPATSAGQGRAGLPKDLAGLAGPFDLAGPIEPEVRYYIQRTDLVYLGFDGKRTGTASFTVKLKIVPAALSGKAGDECTLREVVMRSGEGEPETIPELAGWSYIFRKSAGGIDEAGQVFGIPHDKFLGLKTSRGRTLPAVEGYFIYNSFIDFHAFADVFARPTEGGGGIQDLKTIGQSIRHAAAFTEPPVDLGEAIKKGSVFRNGDVRMTFKGVGVVDGAACAIVGYDSGESTLKIIVPMGPTADIVTEGGSEYIGDIYLDLATRWVRKVTLDEFVVTETRVPAMGATAGTGQGQAQEQRQGQKIQAYTVRHLLTRMVGKEEFEK